MKPIERFCRYVKAEYPAAVMSLTPPASKEGIWHLDITLGGKQVIVEWSLATGFGLSTLSYESYGERPDENYTSLEDAQRRLSTLLTTDEQTAPPLGVLLSRLRENRGRTQQELADKLGIRQATISGMEGRDDMQFSTLRRVIRALGGTLEIFAVFADARYRLTAGAAPLVEPRSARGASVLIEALNVDYEDRFEALRKSGELSHAKKAADKISSRHAVLEMAD